MSLSLRATCWSITINNPTENETKCEVPGWKMEGQYEEGKEGTRHFQGMLKTPQVRFAQVKKAFPRAHIEVARNKEALALYVNKKETRVAIYEAQGVPSMFEYQLIVASRWNNEVFQEYEQMYPTKPPDEHAMLYLDNIVSSLIVEGYKGIEFIAINPMWRASWKKFYSSIIIRHGCSSIHGTHSQVQEVGAEDSVGSVEQIGGEEGSQEGS